MHETVKLNSALRLLQISLRQFMVYCSYLEQFHDTCFLMATVIHKQIYEFTMMII